MVNYIQEGYNNITANLIVNGGLKAIEFYKKAFGAKDMGKAPFMMPDGKLGHAELIFGDSRIMLNDEFHDMGAFGPRAIGGTPVILYLYVQDVDTTVRQAVGAGATLLKEPKDQFYGDRTALLQDPFGHLWQIATHKEDVSEEEMSKRAAAMFKNK